MSLQDVQLKKYIHVDTDETDSDIEPPEGVLRMNARASVERSMNAALASLTSVDGDKYAVKYSAEYGLVGEEQETLRRAMSHDDRLYEQQTLPTGTIDGQDFYSDLYKAAFQTLRDKLLTRKRKNMDLFTKSLSTEKRVLEEARAVFKSEVANSEAYWQEKRAQSDKEREEIDSKVTSANAKIRAGNDAAANKLKVDQQAAKLIADTHAQCADMLKTAKEEAAKELDKGRSEASKVTIASVDLAQKRQEEMHKKAFDDANVVRGEATAEANRIREQATADANRIREQATEDANRIRDQATEAATAIRAEASAFLASLKKGHEADEATDDQAQVLKGSEKKARGGKGK